MLLLAVSPGIGFALPVAFLIGAASILYMTSTTAIVQVEAKSEMHGRVLALQSVLMMGTTPIGGPFSGWLADTLGSRAPIFLGGIVCLLAAAFGYYASRRYLENNGVRRQLWQ
jgi:MFS family permease